MIICLSLTAVISGIFIADENARRISLGDKSAVIVLNSNDEKVRDGDTDISPYLEKLESAAKKAAGIAPPPINNIYWFAVNTKKLWN